MLIDGDTLPQKFSARGQICVVGSGPAGIAISLALARKGIRVLLIEAGPLHPTAESQDFYEGVNKGINYPLSASRTRAFGGSSNCWGGWCRQLERIEFQARPWMQYTGWPVSHSEISRYYSESSKMLGIDGHEFRAKALAKLSNKHGSSICGNSRVIDSRCWQVTSSPLLGSKYESVIAGSATLSLIYNTAAIRLVSPAHSGMVGELSVLTRGGKQGTVKAKSFVLALGGIETCRLLFNSPTESGKLLGGYWLGRGFMEHPARVNGWRIYIPNTRERMLEEGGSVPTETAKKNFRVAYGFGLSEHAQRHYKLPGFWGVLGADVSLNEEEASTAKALLRSMGVCGNAEPRAVDVTWAMEQRVNTDSRIELSDTHDSQGVRRVALTWKILPEDAHAVGVIQKLIATDLYSRKIGRMRVIRSLSTTDSHIDFGNHHMGATRMAVSVKSGVVDMNCRVFGTKNLYIVGSGVFPTSAVTNPTFAVVALALRLSNHLAV